MLLRIEQGSDEWHDIRAGKITASRLGDVLANPSTKRYKQYMYELLKELEGEHPSTVSDSPRWAEHGKRYEMDGIRAYQWQQGEAVEHDVFCIHDEFEWFACSPDGLIVDENDQPKKGLELKCRSKMDTYLKAVMYVRKNGQPEPVYKPQLQGSMLVTGLKQWDYANYIPLAAKSKLYATTVHADALYQAKIMDKALSFRAELLRRFNGIW